LLSGQTLGVATDSRPEPTNGLWTGILEEVPPVDEHTEHVFETADPARDTPQGWRCPRATVTPMPGRTPLTLVDVPGLYPGVPYAYAATAPSGSMLVLTAGACPLDATGLVAGLGDVLKSTVYVATTRREDLVAAWEVVQARMGAHRAPSTLLGVTVLGWPDQLVEVEALAAVPADDA
jgi:hypothetical protein